MAPALMTRADLRTWFAGLGLTAREGQQLIRRCLLDAPITFTTPAGDHWTIRPLITGAFFVAPGSEQ